MKRLAGVALALLLLTACEQPVAERIGGQQTELDNGFRKVKIDGKDCLVYERDQDGHSHVFAFDCDWNSSTASEVPG